MILISCIEAIKMMILFLTLLCSATCVLSTTEHSSPKIIVIGAGSAGIGAASRLLENGFNDVTILEAENRIGGRVNSVKMGDYMVDLGGQWVHGETGNVVFDLVWPLGLIERMNENYNFSLSIFDSSGVTLSPEICDELLNLLFHMQNVTSDVDQTKNGSYGEYAEAKMDKFFKEHSDIPADLHKPLIHMMDLAEMAAEAGDNWHEVSIQSVKNYPDCEGDHVINWKNRTYSTIFDVLMKKYPDPEKELPVMNCTHLNSKVTKIDYTEDSAPIKVSTADGKEYLADHVIFTPSLGVLKANHEKLFNPTLPEKKVTTIQNLGFGHVGKILLYYDNPWWTNDEDKHNTKFILWNEAEKKNIENDPNKKWMLGILGFLPMEHKPKILCIWMSSNLSTEVEKIPEELLKSQVMEVTQKFFGKKYTVTPPSIIMRSMWNTNENFLGTYSYHKLETEIAKVSDKDLAQPVTRNGKPILQFAGEATAHHYATVHGGVESGWREADRIINLYSKKDAPGA